MNRAELVRRLAAHRAAVDALETALDADLRAEYAEQGTRGTHRLDGARVTASVYANTAVVAEETLFLLWLRKRYPGVVIEQTKLVVASSTWLKGFLESAAKRGPVARRLGDLEETEVLDAVTDSTGEVIPGVRYRAGGEYKSTSMTVDPEVVARLSLAAQRYASEGVPMPELEGLFRAT